MNAILYQLTSSLTQLKRKGIFSGAGKIAAFLLLFAIITTVGCRKDCDKSSLAYCNTTSPLTEKVFIKRIISINPSKLNISELTYNGNEGYQIASSQGTADFTDYYDCDGNGMYQSGGVIGTTYPSNFSEKTTHIKDIYP